MQTNVPKFKNRQTFRPPSVRRTSYSDKVIVSVMIFLKKVIIQLSKTLAATALSAAADHVRRMTDPDTAKILTKHGSGQQAEAQKNLYGSGYSGGYQSNNAYGNGGNQYSGYEPRRTYGAESFPGFGN